MRSLQVCMVLAAALAATPAWAQTAPASGTTLPDKIVVSATRTETTASAVASSVSVVTSDDIASRQVTNVADALRTLPGVTVSRSGGPGQTTTVFLRGTKSEHTLVLIDGVEANDPSTPGRTFDFASLSTDNIERIEVIRGPQSTLYGSNAIGGVINIITKGGGVRKPSGWLTLEAGSYNTFRESAGFSGGDKRFQYSMSVTREDTSSVSAVDGGRENDPAHITNGSLKLTLNASDNLGFDLILRAADSRTRIDGFNNTTFTYGDLDSRLSTQNYYTRLQSRFNLFDDQWQGKVGLSYNKTDRFNETYPGYGDIENARDNFTGDLHKIDLQNDLYFFQDNIITFGAEYANESSSSRTQSLLYGNTAFDASTWTGAVYAQEQFQMLKPFYLTIGGRLDEHESFGTAPTWRVAPAYVIEDSGTKFKASYGTGFKAPTLFQLYSSYGNSALEPEKSRGWDAGIEQYFMNKSLLVSAVYFENNISNLIDYDFATSKYNNIGKAQTRGVELSAAWQVSPDLTLNASYTYTHAEDRNTGLDLVRRPNHAAGIAADWAFMKRAKLNIGLDYNSERDDIDLNTFSRIRNTSYVLLHAAVSYDVTDNVQIFARVENGLDVNYQEVAGFQSPGIGAYAGVKLSF